MSQNLRRFTRNYSISGSHCRSRRLVKLDKHLNRVISGLFRRLLVGILIIFSNNGEIWKDSSRNWRLNPYNHSTYHKCVIGMLDTFPVFVGIAKNVRKLWSGRYWICAYRFQLAIDFLGRPILFTGHPANFYDADIWNKLKFIFLCFYNRYKPFFSWWYACTRWRCKSETVHLKMFVQLRCRKYVKFIAGATILLNTFNSLNTFKYF